MVQRLNEVSLFLDNPFYVKYYLGDRKWSKDLVFFFPRLNVISLIIITAAAATVALNDN